MVPLSVVMSHRIESRKNASQLIPVWSHGVLRTDPKKDIRNKIEIQ